MFVPDFAEPCSVSLHLAVRVGRLGRAISPRFAHRYHAEPTLAVVFTAEKLLAEWDLIFSLPIPKYTEFAPPCIAACKDSKFPAGDIISNSLTIRL
jgi:hypothetical protein